MLGVNTVLILSDNCRLSIPTATSLGFCAICRATFVQSKGGTSRDYANRFKNEPTGSDNLIAVLINNGLYKITS
jgi:hypothetical protein